MQLHALLESYLYFGDSRSPITIVYQDRPEYSITKAAFDTVDVEWYKESDFNGFHDTFGQYVKDDLADHTLILVDDQLIVGDMDLSEANVRLETDDNLHCYSFRLGTNIANPPSFDHERFSLLWEWKDKFKDWGYPFSLDATVYRTDFLERVLNAPDCHYRVPADFEAEGLRICHREWLLAELGGWMACPTGRSVAICQDLNKVQFEHGAPCFGTEGVHDTETLLDQYVKGVRIDWRYAAEQAKLHPPTDAFVRDAYWKTTDPQDSPT